VPDESKAVAVDVVPGPDGLVRFDVKGKLYSPEEISARVLRKLVDDAASTSARRCHRPSSRCRP